MHKLLARQVKRILGRTGEDALDDALRALAAKLGDVDTQAGTHLARIRSLFVTVDQTYEQFDKDISMRTRKRIARNASTTSDFKLPAPARAWSRIKDRQLRIGNSMAHP